jgi:Flp pilus assembly protein TadG
MTLPGRLGRDRRGSVAVLAGVGMTALIGMAAFAIDFGAAYAQRAQLQQVADSAALAGAISWVKTGSATAVAATVKDVVVVNGWSSSIIQSSAAPTTKTPNVTVSLSTPFSLTLGGVLRKNGTVTTAGYAVASVTTTTTPACVLSLSTITVDSGSGINANGCSVAANSTGSQAILLNSSGKITANTISTPGTIDNSGGTVSGTEVTGSAAKAVADPYSAVQSQASGSFTNCTNYTNQTTLTKGGCYSNVNPSSKLTLDAGTYFFTDLNMNSGASIVGSGDVTIVVQGSANLSGSVTLTAPNSGTWDGIAFYVMGNMNINSGTSFDINGAIYSPSSTLNIDSGTFNQAACTYIVADGITFNSNATLTLPQKNCSTYGYTAPSIPSGSKIALLQ